MKLISKITATTHIDEAADTLLMGEYTDSPISESICRSNGRFYRDVERAEKIIAALDDIIYDEDEKPEYIAMCEARKERLQDFVEECTRGVGRHLYKYFTPANPDDAVDSYKRAEALNNGEWHFVGIEVTAYTNCKCCGQNEKIAESTLWNIESDTTEYHNEVIKEMLEEIKRTIADKYDTEYLTLENVEKI